MVQAMIQKPSLFLKYFDEQMVRDVAQDVYKDAIIALMDTYHKKGKIDIKEILLHVPEKVASVITEVSMRPAQIVNEDVLKEIHRAVIKADIYEKLSEIKKQGIGKNIEMWQRLMKRLQALEEDKIK